MTALRRRQPPRAVDSPTPRDTQNLLSLARTLRDRAHYLLTRPETLSARARGQLAGLHERQVRELLTLPPAGPGDPCRRDPAHTELLATLSRLRRAVDIEAGLQPRIGLLVGEIEELLTMAGRAASPVRMFLSPRHARDAAQVAATHLRRFMLSISTLRLADEMRRRCTEFDCWRPDALLLWDDYERHTASYDILLAGIAGGHDE